MEMASNSSGSVAESRKFWNPRDKISPPALPPFQHPKSCCSVAGRGDELLGEDSRHSVRRAGTLRGRLTRIQMQYCAR